MELNFTHRAYEPSRAAVECLGDIGKLYDLARDRTSVSKKILANRICSVLKSDLSERQSDMVAEVLSELLRQAEKDLRAALAERLSIIDTAPADLIIQLANDEIDVSKIVLVNSVVLADLDLIYIIKSKGAEYWQAIAERKKMSDQVMDMLADTGDFDTALILLENKCIKLTNHTMTALADLAQGADLIALPLLRRDEIPSEIAKVLYMHVGAEIKKFITDFYDIDDNSKVSESIAKTVDEFTSMAKVPAECMPEEYMLEVARGLKEKNTLKLNNMIGTLRRNNMRSFVAQLSVFTNVEPETIVKLLLLKEGQGLAQIAKAYGFGKQDFISIFMLTGKLWKYGSFVSPDDIRKAVKSYDSLDKKTALELINSNT